MACNTPHGPYLVWRAVGLGPIRSIGWSCRTLAPLLFILTVLLNLHLKQVTNPYLLVVRRRWLRVSCVENRNLTSAENLKLVTARKPTLDSSILVAYPPSHQGEWVTPLVHSQHKLDSKVGGGAQGPWKISSIYGVFKHKIKTKPLRIRLSRMRQQTSPDSLLLNLWRM